MSQSLGILMRGFFVFDFLFFTEFPVAFGVICSVCISLSLNAQVFVFYLIIINSCLIMGNGVDFSPELPWVSLLM